MSTSPDFQFPQFNCPSAFWPAFGYFGAAQSVGIFWACAPDAAGYFDGCQMFTGADAEAYQLLMQARLEPSQAVLFGSSTSPASHLLVINRHIGTAVALPFRAAQAQLTAQAPPATQTPFVMPAFADYWRQHRQHITALRRVLATSVSIASV